MRTWLREQGYRFYIYARDHAEPPHVHVSKAGRDGRWRLDEAVVMDADGYTAGEQRQVRRIIEEHLALLQERHREPFGI
jgi:hypothetical protein